MAASVVGAGDGCLIEDIATTAPAAAPATSSRTSAAATTIRVFLLLREGILRFFAVMTGGGVT